MKNYNIKNKVEKYCGFYNIQIKDTETGNIIKTINGKNLVTYQGADILARTLSGNVPYPIKYMYFETADPGFSGYIENSLNGLVALKTDTLDTMNTPPRSTIDSEVPIFYSTLQRSDESIYKHNVIIFNATLSNSLVNNRIIVGVGLVSDVSGGPYGPIPGPGDVSKYLFSHAYIPGHIKLPGQEIMIQWGVQFV